MNRAQNTLNILRANYTNVEPRTEQTFQEELKWLLDVLVHGLEERTPKTVIGINPRPIQSLE